MGVFGVGMGLVISQLGNVVQSSVGERDRSEAGGLQNTAQQLGSSLGTALLGAVVITGLIAAFVSNVESDPAIPPDVKAQVQLEVASGASFVSADQVEARANELGVDQQVVGPLVARYQDAQLTALKVAFLFAAFSDARLAVRHAEPADRAVRRGRSAGGGGGGVSA